MTAKQYDLILEQGSTFELEVLYKNSTGSAITTISTAEMTFRDFVGSSTAVLSVLSSGGGESSITITAAAGQLEIVIPSSETDDISAPSVLVYDLECTDTTGRTWRLLEGLCTVRAEVTR